MHSDLDGNIMLHPETGMPVLIDFDDSYIEQRPKYLHVSREFQNRGISWLNLNSKLTPEGEHHAMTMLRAKQKQLDDEKEALKERTKRLAEESKDAPIELD